MMDNPLALHEIRHDALPVDLVGPKTRWANHKEILPQTWLRCPSIEFAGPADTEEIQKYQSTSTQEQVQTAEAADGQQELEF